MKKFMLNESGELTSFEKKIILREGTPIGNSIILETIENDDIKEDDKVKTTCYVIAKEQKDDLYEELEKINDVRDNIKKKIEDKYSDTAKIRIEYVEKNKDSEEVNIFDEEYLNSLLEKKDSSKDGKLSKAEKEERKKNLEKGREKLKKKVKKKDDKDDDDDKDKDDDKKEPKKKKGSSKDGKLSKAEKEEREKNLEKGRKKLAAKKESADLDGADEKNPEEKDNSDDNLTLDQIVDKMTEQRDLIIHGGVSDQVIQNAEKDLNLSFTKDYKDFLRNYGCISAGNDNFAIYGLGGSSRFNVIEKTLDARKHNRIPSDSYIIRPQSMNLTMILQKSDGKIYEFQRENGLIEVSDSFLEFLKKLV